MKLQVLDIPESQAERVGWLERLIAGPDLGDVAAELAALHGDGTDGQTLEQVLGAELSGVVEQGLGILSANTLTQLLRQPTLLLKLQERVLAENRPYWERLLERNYTLTAASDRIASRTQAAVEALSGTPGGEAAPASSWLTHPLLVALVTAAAVGGIWFGVQSRQPPPAPVAVGWGWSKPGALNQTLTPSDYLKSLAVAAGEWDKKRPEDAASIALRIAQFRQGCTQLILAEHRPLAPADREWLVGKCREWAQKLDAHLAAIEAGRPALEVRTEADVTISKLITALNTRAESV